MRPYLLALIFLAPISSGSARADTFSYDFKGSYADTFTFVSPSLIKTDQNITPNTCSSGTFAFTGPCSVFFNLSDQLIFLQFTSAGIQHGFLGAAFFTVGTHTVNGDTLTITPLASAVTPEPSSVVLLGTGIFGLLGVARRQLVGR